MPTIDEIIDNIRQICRAYESSTDKIRRIWQYLEDIEKIKNERR